MCHGSIAMSKITSGQNAVQHIQNWHGAIQGNAWQNEKAASSDSTLQRGLCTTGDHSRTETSSLRLGSPPQDVAAPLRRDLSRATFDLHIEILRATLVHVAHPRALEEVPTSSTSSRGATSSDLMFPLWTAAPYFKKNTCSQPIYGKLKHNSGYTIQYIPLFGLVRVGAFPRKSHGIYQHNCVGNGKSCWSGCRIAISLFLMYLNLVHVQPKEFNQLIFMLSIPRTWRTKRFRAKRAAFLKMSDVTVETQALKWLKPVQKQCVNRDNGGLNHHNLPLFLASNGPLGSFGS